MKNLRLFSVILLVASGWMMTNSCSKQRIEETILNAYSKPEKFMYDNRPEEQVFVINGDSAGPIIGNQGTHLWMDSTLFMFADSSDVPYPITIKLVELYKAKDMMLYEMPTVAQNVPLVTGGEIRVRAFKGNIPIYLKPNKVYPAQMPSETPLSAMSIYYGSEISDNVFDWYDQASAVSSNPGINALEQINTDSTFYSLLIPMLGWINADFLYTWNSSNATLKLESDVDDLTNVVKYAFYPQTRSVVQFYGNTSINLPSGEPVTIVCFAMNTQGVMFKYIETVNPNAGENIVNVTMSQVTEDGLLTLMNDL
jgi:hypothetical protein